MAINSPAYFPIFAFFGPFSSGSHQSMLARFDSGISWCIHVSSPIMICFRRATPSQWYSVKSCNVAPTRFFYWFVVRRWGTHQLANFCSPRMFFVIHQTDVLLQSGDSKQWHISEIDILWSSSKGGYTRFVFRILPVFCECFRETHHEIRNTRYTLFTFHVNFVF